MPAFQITGLTLVRSPELLSNSPCARPLVALGEQVHQVGALRVFLSVRQTSYRPVVLKVVSRDSVGTVCNCVQNEPNGLLTGPFG